MAQKRRKETHTMIIKPDAKYKITDPVEMAAFIHMKRKGASQTKNGRAYNRREKHKQHYAA